MKATGSLRPFLLAALLFVTGCSFFSRQPPLPRRAAVESDGGDEVFSKLVESADIIYFPIESVLLRPRSGAAWKLLHALKRGEVSFALACDMGAGEEDVRRALLAEADGAEVQILALHGPPELASEAPVVRQQLSAEKIASWFKDHRSEKLLVFLRREEVRGDYGVPYFVAQKTKARQLILNPRRHRESAAGLLARN